MKRSLSFRPAHTVYFAAAALTLLNLFLYIFALLFSFDAEIGYFKSGAFLPSFATALLVLSCVGLLVLPFLLTKELTPAPTVKTPLGHGGAAAAALSAFSLLLALPRVFSPAFGATVIYYLAIFLLVPAIAFFLLPARPVLASPRALCGYAAVLGAACLLSLTYFDSFTPMNAPHKVLLHCALLSVMLYLVYEIRAILGCPMPRMHLATSAVAFLLCTVAGVSHVIAFFADVFTHAGYFYMDLYCFGLALYIGTRCFEAAKALCQGDAEGNVTADADELTVTPDSSTETTESEEEKA